MAFGSMAINITGNTAGLSSSIERGIGGAIKKVAGMAAGIFAGVKVGSFLKGAVMQASDLGESINAVRVSLGRGAESFLAFGKGAADALGITQAQLNSAVVPMAALLSNAGVQGAELSRKLQVLATRATDVGSVFNRDVNEVLEAFGGAMRGETEPIRAFGISLDAASIAAKAVEMGLASSVKEVSNSAKVQAAYALVLDQSSKFAGDFANTSDGLANRTKIARANFQELQATLGTELMPAVNNVLGRFVDLIRQFRAGEGAMGGLQATLSTLGGYLSTTFGPGLATLRDRLVEAGPGLRDLVQGLAEMGLMVLPALAPAVEAVGLLALALGSIGGFVEANSTLLGTFVVVAGTFATVMWAASLATGAWAAATAGLNALLWAQAAIPGPMMIITAIAALAAGFIFAWKKSETFRNIVTGVFNKIVGAVGGAIKFIIKAGVWWVDNYLMFFQKILEGLGHIPKWLGGGKFDDAANAIQNLRNTIANGVDGINAEIDRIVNDVQINVQLSFNEQINPNIVGQATAAKNEAAADKAWQRNPTNIASTQKVLTAAASKVIKNAGGSSSGGSASLAGGGGGGGGGPSAAATAAKKAAEDFAKALKTTKRIVGAKGFVDSISGGTDNIKAAFEKLLTAVHDSGRKGTEKWVKLQRDAILKVARSRDANLVKLLDAKAVLKDLRAEKDAFSASVRKAVVDLGAVTEAPKGPRASLRGIANNLKDAIKQTGLFTTAIASLTKLGLDKTSLQQLVAAGPEAGLAAAQALVRGGKAGVKEIAGLQGQLDAAGRKIGEATASTFFQHGVDIAKGLVKGLESEEARLERSMTRLGKAMAKALRKELKIASPSGVGIDISRQLSAGLVKGADMSRADVQSAGARLGQSITFGAGSVQVNGVADPLAARRGGYLAGDAIADILSRQKVDAALAGVRT